MGDNDFGFAFPDDEQDKPATSSAEPAVSGSDDGGFGFQDPNTPKPKKEDTTDYSKLSGGDAFMRGIENLPSSFVKTVGSLGHAVMNPAETLGALGELGKGALSAGEGYFMKQDQPQKQKDEALFNQFVQHYKDVYGDILSGASGLKKEWSNDPMSILMDASTFAPVVGAAGKVAGLGKAASIAEKALSLADPTQLALSAAGKLTDLGGFTTKGILGATSGAHKDALDAIEDIGRNRSAAAQAAFLKGANTGEKIEEQIPNMYDQAVGQFGDLIKGKFGDMKSGLASTRLNVDQIKDAIARARGEIGAFRIDPKTGKFTSRDFPDEAMILNEMERRLLSSSPADLTAAGLHNYKMGISDLLDSLHGSKVLGALGKVPEAVKETIKTASPEYADMMDLWGTWRKDANELRRSFGDKNVPMSVKMAKLLKSLKNGKNNRLFELLRQTEAGKYLPEYITGAAVRHWLPDWSNRVQNWALTGLAGAQLGFGLPHFAGAALAASPKVVGHGTLLYGNARRLADLAGQAYTPALGNIASQIGETIPQDETASGSYFSGGRIARQSGGRVGDAGAAADKLIRAAKQAKNRHSDDTSPLLDVPDEAITKALAIANEKI